MVSIIIGQESANLKRIILWNISLHFLPNLEASTSLIETNSCPIITLLTFIFLFLSSSVKE